MPRRRGPAAGREILVLPGHRLYLSAGSPSRTRIPPSPRFGRGPFLPAALALVAPEASAETKAEELFQQGLELFEAGQLSQLTGGFAELRSR